MKRAFSLIEMMISFALFTIVLTSLFCFYNHLTQSKIAIEEKKWPLLEERYCHQRLNKIFSTCDLPFFTSQERYPNLASGSLVFTFDRGIADDPLLCGRVLARLYQDPEKKRLCLGVWPFSEKVQEPAETYVLLTDVSSCKMQFYQPPSFDSERIYGGNQPEWTAESLPAIIELELTHHDRNITFAFDLGSPIRYPRGHL